MIKKAEVSRGAKRVDVRRAMALVMAIILLSISAVAHFTSASTTDSSRDFLIAASGRIGIVLAALWLAWPSLKRPTKWLPASAPVIGVIALIVIAAQPKLLLPTIPIVGGLITLSAIVRAFRGAKN